MPSQRTGEVGSGTTGKQLFNAVIRTPDSKVVVLEELDGKFGPHDLNGWDQIDRQGLDPTLQKR
jgi:hypothetical protein